MKLTCNNVLCALLLFLLAGCSGSAPSGFTGQQPEGKTPINGETQGSEPLGLAVLKDAAGIPIGIQVTWTRVTTPGVQGYFIYRDTTSFPDGDPAGYVGQRVDAGGVSGMYDQPDSGDTVSFDDNFSPEIGETYYYRLTVVNVTDDESDFSNELSLEIAEHSITSVTQDGGYIGDEVTITGTWFGTWDPVNDKVYFSDADGNIDVEATNYPSWTQTEIVVRIPYGAADGRVAVDIGGTVVNSPADQTVDYTEPVITSVNPDADWVQNQYIAIFGSNFGPPPDLGGSETVIYFGSVAADISDINLTDWPDNIIEVLVPAGAEGGPQDIVVSVAGNDSNGQAFTVMPNVDSLSQDSGSTGTTVTLTGTSFGDSQGDGTVTVNGTAATISSWQNTEIELLIPAAAVDGEIVVTDDHGSDSIGVSFDVIPTLDGFDPLRLAPGSLLTINGSGFGTSQNAGTVVFDGQSGSPVDVVTYDSWTPDQIVVIVPDGCESGPLTVNIDDNSAGSDIDSVTSADEFIVLLPSPVIVNIGQI